MKNCTGVDETLTAQIGVEQPNFLAQLLPQLMDLVKVSRRLPLGEEHAIRRGSKEFLASSKELGQKSMNAVQRTLRFLDPNSTQGTIPEELVNFSLVEDSIDTVLERVDSCLKDALSGQSKPTADLSEAGSGDTFGLPTSSVEQYQSQSAAVPKPQVRWRELVDNDRTEFVPRLLVKHNQQVPLPASIIEAQQRVGMRSGGANSVGKGGQSAGHSADSAEESSALQSHLAALGVENEEHSALPHPYEDELRSLAWPDSLFEIRKPERYASFEETPLVWVRTERELRQLVREVKTTCVGKEIAVDVEHHDNRSYRGFICLVQLSTRQKDYIIDPFDIFDEMHMLNEVFSDPRIVKVLHGADRDVHWLQRDFSIYIVNMFDTGQATRALRLQGGFSLANLVSHFTGVKLDKKHQTSDWRMRPLLPEMAHYARCDTHYLLYLYDCVRNALLAGGQHVVSKEGIAQAEATAEGVMALRGVLDKSAAICLTLYTETPFDAANAAMRLSERFGSKQRPLEPRQFSTLQALTGWRDALARRIDESVNYVAPDACLWRLALAMPTTAMRMRSAVNPLPPLLQQNCLEVVDLIARTPEAGKVAASDSSQPPSASVASSASPGVAVTPATLEPARSLIASSEKSGAGKPPATPQQQDQAGWPSRSCSKLLPIVHVSSGSMRLNGSENPPKLHVTLSEMFESDSEEDALEATADSDIIASLPESRLIEKVEASATVEASAQVQAEALAGVEAEVSARAEAQAQAEAIAQELVQAEVAVAAAELEAAMAMDAEASAEVEGSGVAFAEVGAQSLRDAYNLPRPATRKKKKKRLAQDMAAEIAKSAAQVASSLETEAATFRNALVGAQGMPSPKRSKTVAHPDAEASAVFIDPYATVATLAAPDVVVPTEHSAIQDPYAVVADPYAVPDPVPAPAVISTANIARAVAVPNASSVGQPQNGQPAKKKKKKRPAEPAAPATVMDPYL